MPSYQISFLMMFVGKCLCTSHVLQYSSCLSYEHSRSPQSFLCSGAVTVLICSFFVAALLILHNFKKRQQIYTLFHNPPNIFQTIFRPKLHIHKVYKKISGHGMTGTVLLFNQSIQTHPISPPLTQNDSE